MALELFQLRLVLSHLIEHLFKLGTDSVLLYHTNAGQHALTATTDTASTQNFELQAGATYYMKAGVIPHQFLFQPSLSVVFDLQGQSAIQNLKRLAYCE